MNSGLLRLVLLGLAAAALIGTVSAELHHTSFLVETAPSSANVTAPQAAPPALCVNLTRSTDCADRDDCLWCATNQTCSSVFSISGSCASGFCQGQACDSYECTHTLFPCTKSIVGMLLSMAIYGVILAFGAKTISDGSELLLDLFPNAGTVIGALLLPVLGAVPDAAIVVASGIGSIEEAQEQLNVGIGTLAGSTIMLLTVPWAASTFIARCDLDSNGQAIDGKLTRGCSLTRTGITVDKDTPTNARIMVGTAFSYLIVQGVAFAYLKDPDGASAKNMEHYFALAGFIVCSILFIAYAAYQIMVPKLAEKRKEKAAEARRERSMMLHAFYYLKRTGFLEKVASTPNDHSEAHARASALKLGRRWRAIAARRRAIREAKRSRSDSSSSASGLSEKTPLIQEAPHEIDMSGVSDHASETTEEPETEEPFWKTLLTSIALMVFGAGLVTVFSDPMVDVINDFASKEYGIGIPAFYVSFLITPYCSNASEVISSLIFAAKKRKANTSMTFSQLYGAATMNATFVLSIFFALIAFRGLSWTFSAETVAILTVTLLVGALASFKRHFATWWAFPVLSLYPLSLVLVYLLETFANWR